LLLQAERSFKPCVRSDSPASSQVTLLSLPSCASCPTSSLPLTVATLPPWSFWTCQRLLTRSTTTSSYSVSNRALGSPTSHGDWFRSYLSGRRQYMYVRCGGIRSCAVPLICGVPQGSVLGPVLFILHVADLAALVESHGLTPHQYADDTQIYGSCSPSHVDDLSSTISGLGIPIPDPFSQSRDSGLGNF